MNCKEVDREFADFQLVVKFDFCQTAITVDVEAVSLDHEILQRFLNSRSAKEISADNNQVAAVTFEMSS